MKRGCLIFSLTFAATSLLSVAQERAALTVKVTDASGAAFSDAHVVARLNTKSRTASDVKLAFDQGTGGYTASLAPGIYDLLISAPCAVPAAKQVKLAPGKRTLAVQLKLQIKYFTDGCPTPDTTGPKPPLEGQPEEDPAPDQLP